MPGDVREASTHTRRRYLQGPLAMQSEFNVHIAAKHDPKASMLDIFFVILKISCNGWDILLRIIQGIFEGLKWKNWLLRAQNQFHVI